MAALRTSGKCNTTVFQESTEKESDEIISVINLRSQKAVLTHGDEQDLFKRVLVFLQEFFANKEFHKKVEKNLRRQKSCKEVKKGSQQNDQIFSFKKMSMGSRICFEGEVTRKESPCKYESRVVRANNKKISIFVMEEDFSEQSEEMFSENSLFSESSVKTIRSIDIPQMDMNSQTIALIFESPQPFLINLSLCLMLRYCLASKRKICFEDSAWVLSVATVVAYKLYYDEEIEGLMDCFMEVMKASRKDLIDLERCFLGEIGYNTVIYNNDYHFILSTLLALNIQ